MAGKRFKQFDPAYAPKNQEKAREYVRLEDTKMDLVLARIEDKRVRGQIDDDEALYLRDYAERMRRHWGRWFDSTSVSYIVLGGQAEIGCHQRALRWQEVVAKLKEQDADTAA